MRKFIVVVLSLLLVPALAVPASAERPVRYSGTYEGAYASSTSCTAGGRTTCTDTWVDVWEEPGGELVTVCVYQDTYAVGRNSFRYTGSRGGCSDVAGSQYSSSGTGSASLAPTVVEYGDWRCTKDDECTFTPEGAITVSLSLTSDGSSERTSGRGSYVEDGCTYKYSYTSTGGHGTGTITIDGVDESAWGFVERSTYKTTETCG